MSIDSIMILFIEPQYTAEYIANVFWRQLIAQVGIITLLTYVKNNHIYSMAYITIDEWHDTENAYNFIQRLKNPNLETRIVHSEDNWWPVYISNYINPREFIGPEKTIFNTFYFKSKREYEDQYEYEEQTKYEDHYHYEEQTKYEDQYTISTKSMTNEDSDIYTIDTQYSRIKTNTLNNYQALDNIGNLTCNNNLNKQWFTYFMPKNIEEEDTIKMFVKSLQT